MSGRALTLDFYNALLAAYREAPGNYSRAATIAGCDRATAKRGWERGWSQTWAPPIQQVIADEHVYLRAARQTASEEADKLVAVKLAEIESDVVRKLEEANIKLEMASQSAASADEYYAKRVAEAERNAKARYNELLDKAKVDALETIGDEANMSKMGRKAAMGSVFIAASFFQNAKLLADKFAAAFAQAEFTPQQAMAAGMMLTRLTQQANEAVRVSLENERLRLGKPTDILGITSASGEEQSMAEIEIELEAVQEALARIKENAPDASSAVTTAPVAQAPTGNNGGSNGGAVH